jgi:uncharacterized membrane protein (UPF0127 family)
VRTINIEIADKEYKVLVAESEEEKRIGLSNIQSMDDNEGMLFDYSKDLQNHLIFNTKNMSFPIDVIFIDDEDEVVAVEYGEPGSDELIECETDDDENIKYVLEVNANSGIKIGDDLDLEPDDDTKMYILDPKGNPQMDLRGGERVVSRLETRQLIKKAKKANKEKSENAYKKLGKYIFKILEKQDSRDPQYVPAP